MCLTKSPETRACCESASPAALPQSGTAIINRPATPAWHHAPPPQRFLVEVQESPARVFIKDVGTGILLAELDPTVIEEWLGDVDGSLDEALARLSTSTSDDRIEMHEAPTLPHGLVSQVLTQQIAEGDKTLPRKSRHKLWEISNKLHCPLIGTCLDARELRQLARKAGVQADGKLSDYEVHVSFVSAADEKNVLSLVTHKALERKYATQVKRFTRAKTTADLVSLWSDAVTRGEVPSALWATLTHPRCDDALKARAFEEVHMLSHQIGAGQRADLKRLSEAESELSTLQRDFDAMQRRMRRQLDDREQQLLELQSQLNDVIRRHRATSASETHLRHVLTELQQRDSQQQADRLLSDLTVRDLELAAVRQDLTVMQRELHDARQCIAELDTENAALRTECQAMERFIAQSISACDSCTNSECDGNPDLLGRRVLCVGGRNRLIEHYRELVVRCNGCFEHYDGGIEDNRQRLDALLASADAVVCATDTVSHDAYYRLKRFCKRSDKPHVFLRSSGLSSFTRALYDVAGANRHA